MRTSSSAGGRASRPSAVFGAGHIPRPAIITLRAWGLFFALLTACTSATIHTSQPLRVMVYNIHAGKDAAGVDNLERVAALITSSNPDLVLLQEVDRGTTRSGGVDQVATLTRLTNLNGAFGKSLDYQGGEYGIAILSRWPIDSHEVVPLIVNPPQVRAGGAHEPRVALIIETTTPAGKLEVINTHIDASREDDYRLQETRDLLAAVAVRPAVPRIAGGDFNSTPESGVHDLMSRAGFRDAFVECGKGEGLTYPDKVPVKRIDYLWLTGRFHCAAARALDSRASDHRPLFVEITP